MTQTVNQCPFSWDFRQRKCIKHDGNKTLSKKYFYDWVWKHKNLPIGGSLMPLQTWFWRRESGAVGLPKAQGRDCYAQLGLKLQEWGVPNSDNIEFLMGFLIALMCDWVFLDFESSLLNPVLFFSCRPLNCNVEDYCWFEFFKWIFWTWLKLKRCLCVSMVPMLVA